MRGREGPEGHGPHQGWGRTREQVVTPTRQVDYSPSRQCERQPHEHRQVGVERDPLKPAKAKRRQSVFVLEPPELTLDGSAPAVEVAEAPRLARDEWMRCALAASARDGDA